MGTSSGSFPSLCIGDNHETVLEFIIKALPSDVIIIIADQILNDSLYCSNTYNWCFNAYSKVSYKIQLLTFLIILDKIGIILRQTHFG